MLVTGIIVKGRNDMNCMSVALKCNSRTGIFGEMGVILYYVLSAFILYSLLHKIISEGERTIIDLWDSCQQARRAEHREKKKVLNQKMRLTFSPSTFLHPHPKADLVSA